MAGLGTGAAPFRAFLQYRAHLASQNIPVGPAYYYFGSRHRSEEYLYGEEIEAFIIDGTITHAGLAFSRDQKQKIYIQHKMKEDGKALVRMLLKENGVFYLCGPTWPVPDVFEALTHALGEYESIKAEEAGTFLEELKGEERYVLEVSWLLALSRQCNNERTQFYRFTNGVDFYYCPHTIQKRYRHCTCAPNPWNNYIPKAIALSEMRNIKRQIAFQRSRCDTLRMTRKRSIISYRSSSSASL